nr:MAG TPA: hypothetical protein [Caudoviricetes sp.]
MSIRSFMGFNYYTLFQFRFRDLSKYIVSHT